jgi:adenosylhomocysteine nucleosidase
LALCVETGVGVDAAERALRWVFSNSGPADVVMTGFAGALVPELAVGDLLLATEVCDEAGARWPTTSDSFSSFSRDPQGSAPDDKALPFGSRLNGLSGVKISRGPLLTISGLVADPAEKQRLGQLHRCLAADMESAAVARLCHEHGVPFACLRAISDDAATGLSPGLARVLCGGRVSAWRLLTHLVRRPWGMGELLRLGRDTQHAARTLAMALVGWLKSGVGCQDGLLARDS